VEPTQHAREQAGPRASLRAYFFSLTSTDCTCDTGAPPSDDWNVSTTETESPFFCFSAFFSAFNAEALGLSVTLTLPAAAKAVLPFAKAIFAGRHLPASLTWPALHLLADANAPNLPFGNVATHVKVPGSRTVLVNVIAPVFALTRRRGPGGAHGCDGYTSSAAGAPASGAAPAASRAATATFTATAASASA
jgi:hypothetical protein